MFEQEAEPPECEGCDTKIHGEWIVDEGRWHSECHPDPVRSWEGGA